VDGNGDANHAANVRNGEFLGKSDKCPTYISNSNYFNQGIRISAVILGGGVRLGAGNCTVVSTRVILARLGDAGIITARTEDDKATGPSIV